MSLWLWVLAMAIVIYAEDLLIFDTTTTLNTNSRSGSVVTIAVPWLGGCPLYINATETPCNDSLILRGDQIAQCSSDKDLIRQNLTLPTDDSKTYWICAIFSNGSVISVSKSSIKFSFSSDSDKEESIPAFAIALIVAAVLGSFILIVAFSWERKKSRMGIKSERRSGVGGTAILLASLPGLRTASSNHPVSLPASDVASNGSGIGRPLAPRSSSSMQISHPIEQSIALPDPPPLPIENDDLPTESLHNPVVWDTTPRHQSIHTMPTIAEISQNDRNTEPSFPNSTTNSTIARSRFNISISPTPDTPSVLIPRSPLQPKPQSINPLDPVSSLKTMGQIPKPIWLGSMANWEEKSPAVRLPPILPSNGNIAPVLKKKDSLENLIPNRPSIVLNSEVSIIQSKPISNKNQRNGKTSGFAPIGPMF